MYLILEDGALIPDAHVPNPSEQAEKLRDKCCDFPLSKAGLQRSTTEHFPVIPLASSLFPFKCHVWRTDGTWTSDEVYRSQSCQEQEQTFVCGYISFFLSFFFCIL